MQFRKPRLREEDRMHGVTQLVSSRMGFEPGLL